MVDEAAFREGKKQLAVSEANAIRDLGLTLDIGFKEEEARTRKELDQRHTDEQIKLREEQLAAQNIIRKDILGEQAAKDEQDIDLKFSEHFAAVKKQELEKK